MKYLKPYTLFEASISIDRYNKLLLPNQETLDKIKDVLEDLNSHFEIYPIMDKYKGTLSIYINKISKNVLFSGNEIIEDVKELISQLSDQYEFIQYFVNISGCKDIYSKDLDDLKGIITTNHTRFDFRVK